MTKEEKIKEAWGEFWDRLTENQKEYALENNGSVQIGYNIEQTLLYRDIIKSKLFLTQPIFPKSLQGIGNNNGWIKIESEDDLPTDTEVKYWGANQNGVFEGIIFPFESISIKYKNKTLTHYQPIQEPKLPLY